MRQRRKRIWVFTLKYLKLGPMFTHLQKDSSRLGKYKKNDSQKALAISKTAAPFNEISFYVASYLAPV